MTKSKKKSKVLSGKELPNNDFLKAVGKSSILRIDWKSWNELPNSGCRIWIVVRLDKEVVVVTGTYFDETIPASKDGHFPETRWRQVKFDEFGFPDTFVGPDHRDKNAKRLVAWGYHKGIIRLAKIPADWKPVV